MFEEAVRNYTKALEIDANDEALYFNMARAYKEWGNNPEALNNIRKAMELNPKFTEAQSLLKTLQ
jgi:tetratricopeptide (TPR) repeat protein